MREIDEIRIEGDTLVIYDTKGERHRFKMGVPEQVYEEVVAKLATVEIFGQTMSVKEYDEIRRMP